MRRTNIYLEERQAVALDRRAATVGISRAELVRQLIDQGLGAEDVSADIAAIEASFGMARDADDGAGAMRVADDARARYLEDLRRR